MNPNFGLTSEQSNFILQILQKNLLEKCHYKIYVFGSRSKGNERKYSDLDLWIESQPIITQNELVQIFNDFEDSDLSIKIDIVTPQTCLEHYESRIISEIKLWFEK